jgi:tRNA dimethylallyltransferase
MFKTGTVPEFEPTGCAMTTTPPGQQTILILGPTAGGKTSLALSLARLLEPRGECIGADSMQVYRGMDIGTAKPDATELGGVPHHLIDVVEPTDAFTVDHWLKSAAHCEQDIISRGRVPIFVGGTNLYLQSLLGGFLEGPEPDPALRAEFDALDAPALRTRLESVDPASCQRIHPNDRRRTIRALEVHALTGNPISMMQGQWEAAPRRTDVRIIGLQWDPEDINPRINARVKLMFESGFVEEVRALRDADRLGPQAAEALGYKQISEHLAGLRSLQDTIEEVKIRTRRFAKQQRTWLRRFQHVFGGFWFKPAGISSEDSVSKALTNIISGAIPPA